MLSGRADEENAALTTEIGMAEVKASWKGDQLRHIMKTKGGTLDLPHLQCDGWAGTACLYIVRHHT